MGGDHGPSVVVPGVGVAAAWLSERGARVILHGDQAQITAELAKLPAARAICATVTSSVPALPTYSMAALINAAFRIGSAPSLGISAPSWLTGRTVQRR